MAFEVVGRDCGEGGDLAAAVGLSVAAMAQEPARGDELAIMALSTAGWALGMGIGNVANLMNPQRFVLGGGVTGSGDRFWGVIRRVARETALPEVHFDIVPTSLGDEAPLWGAVALAKDLIADATSVLST